MKRFLVVFDKISDFVVESDTPEDALRCVCETFLNHLSRKNRDPFGVVSIDEVIDDASPGVVKAIALTRKCG